MRSFDIDVFESHGSWVIRLEQRIVSGAPSRDAAACIARHAAQSLADSGHEARLRILDGGVAVEQQTYGSIARAAA